MIKVDGVGPVACSGTRRGRSFRDGSCTTTNHLTSPPSRGRATAVKSPVSPMAVSQTENAALALTGQKCRCERVFRRRHLSRNRLDLHLSLQSRYVPASRDGRQAPTGSSIRRTTQHPYCVSLADSVAQSSSLCPPRKSGTRRAGSFSHAEAPHIGQCSGGIRHDAP
jgi:hypothetical protein